MQINLKREQRYKKIEQALKNNLKKRKNFQKQNQRKKINERFIRSMD